MMDAHDNDDDTMVDIVQQRRQLYRRRGLVDAALAQEQQPERAPLSNVCDTPLEYTGSFESEYKRRIRYTFDTATVIFTEEARRHMVPRWFAEKMTQQSGWKMTDGEAKAPVPVPAAREEQPEPGLIRTEKDLELHFSDDRIALTGVTRTQAAYARTLFFDAQRRRGKNRWKELDEYVAGILPHPDADPDVISFEAIDE